MRLQKILLLVIPVYFMQGSFFEPGGTLAKLLNAIWILFIAVYSYKYLNAQNNDKFAKSLLIFWLLLTISWIISPKIAYSPDFGGLATFGEYKNMTLSLMTYFPFAYMVRYCKYTTKDMVWFAYFAALSCIICFVVKQIAAINEQFWLENVTNNAGYMLVTVLPLMGLLLFNNQKKMFYVVLSLFSFLVAFSVKRGAILSLLLIIFCFWYCFYLKDDKRKVTKSNSGTKYVYAFAILSVFGLGLYYVAVSNEYMLLRMQDMLDGDSSGRDNIAESLLNTFINSSLINMLFGHGMSQTLSFAGLYAHNDWLELLTDSGILGVVIYALVFKELWKLYRNGRQKKIQSWNFMVLSVITAWGAKSVFSMGFSVPESCLYLIAIACAKYLPEMNKTDNITI